MKKILFLVMAVIMVSVGNVNAQSAAAHQQTPAKSQMAAPAKTATAKATPAVAEPAPQAQHVTKSGAPDKRFKENKSAATAAPAAAGPVKKDGTPDMRYNANKKAAVKK